LGCSDGNNKLLTQKLLTSIKWEGNIEFTDNSTPNKYEITIDFNVDNTGYCEIIGNPGSYEQTTMFEYTLNGDIISIRGGYKNILEGNWDIIHFNSKKIELNKETDDINMACLKLHS